MKYQNYKQRLAVEQNNKKRLLKLNPDLDENSGIYFLTRTDENGISFFYIGQAKRILTRLAQHLVGYQHIDRSLVKRGLYDENDNPYGWKIGFLHYPESKLDEMEKYWILEYTKQGYQCRYNKTAGGQGEGKEQINEYKPPKGYRDGLSQGRKNLARELKSIIEKHLIVSIKPEKANNKVSQGQYSKFWDLLNTEEENTE
jgi:hypothetical protein